MKKNYEKLADDFLVKLTWGGEHLCPDILRENPEILNTKVMATTIVPEHIGSVAPDYYNLAFRVVDMLCEYRDKGIITEEQFTKTINRPSPETGETLLTSLLKDVLKEAKDCQKKASSVFLSLPLERFNNMSAKLRKLIDQNGKIKVDVNVPNLRGQYPLELIEAMSDGGHLHDMLPTEHNCIRAATNFAVEAKIKHKMTGKSSIEQVDHTILPQTRALVIDKDVDPNDPKVAIYANYSTPSDVSVLKISKPTCLVKDPLSISYIYKPGEYLLTHYGHDDLPEVRRIDKLNTYYGKRLYLRNGNKWNEVPQDKIFDTITLACTKSRRGKIYE